MIFVDFAIRKTNFKSKFIWFELFFYASQFLVAYRKIQIFTNASSLLKLF